VVELSPGGSEQHLEPPLKPSHERPAAATTRAMTPKELKTGDPRIEDLPKVRT
jgi:hypothetical protein